MATLYIAEYETMPTVVGKFVQCGDEGALLAEQTVAISGASAASSAFNARTRFVRIHTDAICSILFGTTPTATTGKKRMAASTTEYFGVPAGLSYKVAVITNT